MFARLGSPAFADVRLAWPQGFTPLWASALHKSVFEGDTVSVYTLFKGALPATVGLAGRASADADADAVQIGCAALPGAAHAGDTLARIAAACRMMPRPENTQQIRQSLLTKFALDYQLVTGQTSFLPIHERAEADKARDMPVLHQVSQMLAAGWSSVGTLAGFEPAASYSVHADRAVRPSAADACDALDEFDAPRYSRSRRSLPAVYRT